jgi:hypothetical protein
MTFLNSFAFCWNSASVSGPVGDMSLQHELGVFVQEEVAMAAVMIMGRVFFNMAANYPQQARASSGFAATRGKVAFWNCS